MEVLLQNAQYTPASLRIRPGDTIRFRNLDTMCHTVARGTPTPGECKGSGSTNEADFDVALPAGAEANITFFTEGMMTVHCKPHSPSMKMELEVRAGGPPGPPLDPRLAEFDGALNLTWSPPESDNGSAVTRYAVHLGTDPQSVFFLADATGTWHNATSLENGKRYWLAVAAVNADGTGPLSPKVSGIPRPPGLALGRVDIEPKLKGVEVGYAGTMLALVYDSMGWEVADAAVKWSVTSGIGTIDQAGRFVATAVGDGEIRAEATRGASTVSNSTKLSVTPKSYAIEGRVVDFRDQGVDGVNVTLFDELAGKELETQVTLSNGSFVFRAPNGQYYLHAYGKGYDNAFYRGITVRDAPVSSITVRIARPGEQAPEWSMFMFFGIIALIVFLALYMIVVRAARGRARREGERPGDQEIEEARDEARPVRSNLKVERSPAPRRRQ